MIHLQNRVIKNPSEMEGLPLEVIESIREDTDTVFPFIMPKKIKGLDFIEGQINTKKRIYKTGFLCEVYSALYPDRMKKDIYELLNDRYDLFLNYRQFHRDVKSYNDKKVHIFVE